MCITGNIRWLKMIIESAVAYTYIYNYIEYLSIIL